MVRKTLIAVTMLTCLAATQLTLASEPFLGQLQQAVDAAQKAVANDPGLAATREAVSTSVDAALKKSDALNKLSKRVGAQQAAEVVAIYKKLLVPLKLTSERLAKLEAQVKKDPNVRAILLKSIPPVRDYEKALRDKLKELDKLYPELKGIPR